MKTRSSLIFHLVLIVVLLSSYSAHPAAAQDDQPPVTTKSTKVIPWPPDKFPSHDSYPSTQAPPLATGGPDDYGYTWNDGIPFNWIDATSGVDSGLSGDDEYTGAINIGFPFKFYENSYDQIYFNTNGLVTFGSGSYDWSNTLIPLQASPNNLVAVLWDDLAVGLPYNSGKVYYQQAGTAPNRYFVVEWYNVTSCCVSPSSEYKTFEAVFFENGEIVLQYLNLSGFLESATVGIEDSGGDSGLQYLYNSAGLSNNKAVKFSPPGPMARVEVNPLYQGKLTHANEIVSFSIPIRNSGDIGTDVYDLTTVSEWAISLFGSNGLTPLTDTDSDGIIDTGPVDQGSTTNIIAKIQVPGVVNIGDAVTTNVTARSSLNTTKSKTISLQTAIPAPFAQVYRDDQDGAMSLYLAQPGAQVAKRTSDSYWWGDDPAVAEAPNGNFIYVWSRGQCLGSNCSVYINNIEYSLLNKYGETVRAVSKLTDNSAAPVSTFDSAPVVAVAPNGHIGVLWYRYTYQIINNISKYNYNIFFAIMDAAGNITYGPADLTNNIAEGVPRNDTDVPGFFSPQITATGDNRFFLAWEKYYLAAGCSGDCLLEDIYYSVHDTAGILVRDVTQFTFDTTGSSSESYFAPNLTDLTGNRVFLSWSRGSDWDVYYAVLQSNGDIFKDKTNLVGDGRSISDQNSDAVQLSDGKIMVGWTGRTDKSNIRFSVLDTAYNVIVNPTVIGNSAATTGNDFVSTTADNAGRAIFTWMNSEWDNYRNLYYALVNGNGVILTPSTIFRTSLASPPYIQTSLSGYGNTTYSSSFAAGTDGAVWFNPSSVYGIPGGIASLQAHYTNHGQTTATGVALTATLGGGLEYQGDTSGVVPVVSGNFVTWFLPNLTFLEEHQFTLNLSVPGTSAVGSSYTVTLTLAENEVDMNPIDNTVSADVVVIGKVYLPTIIR